MKASVALAVALGTSGPVAGCQRVSDFAELECTAHETGLVTDCVVLRSSSREFANQTLSEVSDRGTRPYRGPTAAPTAGEPYLDPRQVADEVTNIHPGYGGDLPRRFRTTVRVSY